MMGTRLGASMVGWLVVSAGVMPLSSQILRRRRHPPHDPRRPRRARSRRARCSIATVSAVTVPGFRAEASARYRRHERGRGARRGVGRVTRKLRGGVMPPPGLPASGQTHLRRAGQLARERARSVGGGEPEPWADREFSTA